MEQIFNNLDQGIIIIDKCGKILMGNDSIVSKLEFSKCEVVGLNIKEIICKDDSITNEVMSNLSMYIQRKSKIKLYSKSGKKKVFNVTVGKEEWKGQDAFYFILDEDILSTNYTKADLERILDEIPYGIWVKNLNGKYVYVNKKYAEIFHKEKCDILLCTDYEIWHENNSDYFKGIDDEVVKFKKPILEQHKFYGAVNEECWFETYKAPLLNKNNEVKYTMGISRDITLSKRLEEELARSHKNMITLNSMITTSDYDAEAVINNIKYDLINRLKADGVSVWIYENGCSKLKPKITFGLSEKFINDIPYVRISKEQFSNMSNWPKDGVIPIEDRFIRQNLIKDLKGEGVKYSGLYRIAFNGEIIGVVHTLYKDNNIYSIKNDDFIKTMCNHFGMIIKNDMLSKDIKCELSKRKEAEEELQLFLDTAVDLVAIVAYDRSFLRVNSGWTDILGWSEEELYSMNSYDIVHPDDIKLTEDIVEELKEKKKLRGVVNRYIAKNGDIHWIEWSSRYIPERQISICTGRDITKLREAEEQKETYEQALALEKVKSEFFSNISHEFKTPLNIILTTMQLIMKNIGSNNQSIDEASILRYMNSIRQNSFRLLKLVNNLIDITKIDAGYYEIHLENQNIVSVVEDITISVAGYMEEKGMELVFDTDVEEEIIACDTDKIERIMLNLLSNAVKYTSKDGKIQVHLKSEDKDIIISVSDDGIGIEEEKIDKIFERFVQVKNNLTRMCEGSGIGLSLVKSLVEMHGGSINVESEFSKGTTFTIRLPKKVLEDGRYSMESKDMSNSKVEKCSIEFSDIYN